MFPSTKVFSSQVSAKTKFSIVLVELYESVAVISNTYLATDVVTFPLTVDVYFALV